MAAASLVPLWKNVYRAVAESSSATDRELLARFAQAGDETAFEVLLRRHAALVLGVCRRVLGNDADAEDACQATFLILARKAATTAWQDSVAGWLHRTAHRLACQARLAASRRARHEQQARTRPSANPLEQLTAQELLGILDEELLRLPERYRAPLVLCYLQGATRDEAAAQLGCPPTTVKSWLARGREKLHRAVQRRGLTLAGVLGATVLASGSRTVAAEAVRRSVRAAVAVAAGRSLSGLVSTNVTQLVDGGLKVMALSKSRAILALLLLCGAFTAVAFSWSSAGAQDRPAGSTADSKKPAEAKQDTKPAAGKRTWQGRVLSPEGKPVPGAKVLFVRQGYDGRGARQDTVAAQCQTGPDGRFQLAVGSERDNQPEPDQGLLLAVAAGYGPGWVKVDRAEEVRDTTVKLVKDDVPLQGRVIDLDGKPIAGVSVRVLDLWFTPAEDLGPWVKHMRTEKSFSSGKDPRVALDATRAGLGQVAHTDRDGRFRLAGFGRERLLRLRFSGPTIEIRSAWAMTRTVEAFVVPFRKGDPRSEMATVHGAVFTHAAAPTRPVVGTVTDRETGKPLAGITVLARPFNFRRGPDNSLVTKTDSEGRYRLVGLPRNAGQTIQAAPDPESGYLPSGMRTPQMVNLDPARLDFKLTRGIVIRGRVTNKATGQPLQVQVEYFVFDDNPYLKKMPNFRLVGRQEPRTRPDGSFTLLGMPGRGIVTATVPRQRGFVGRGPGFLVGVGAEKINGAGKRGDFITWPYIVDPPTHNTLVGLDLAPDTREVTCNLTLDPGKTLTGTVVDPDGKPISGVTLQGIWGYPSAPQRPLATPRFTLPAVDPDRPQPFFFLHRDRKLGVMVMLKGDKTEGITVKLQPMGVITGRLLDPDSVPVAEGALMGTFESGQFGVKEGWSGFFWASVEKEGRFRASVIPGVQVGAYFSTRANRIGARVFEKLTVKPGQVHDVGDIKVNPRPE
jgi:RNA polymerase sigma factor (sigma-70 family)